MKQSNGYVQEPNMESEQQQEVFQDSEQQQLIGNSTVEEASIGTSGEIFQECSLAIKPKGPPLFKLSALYKSRLKSCIFLHFLLFFAMLAKLSEDILDRMDIFILELEELFIPKPMPFEYLWTASIIFAVIGLRGLSRNRLSSLQSYAAGIVTLGICPLIGAAIWFYPDLAEYADKKQEAQIEKWQGIPVVLYWYGFLYVALQVHMYSLYFAWKLIKIWRVKLKRV